MPLEPAKGGLLARADEYRPLRAFSQTGRYWDRVPQQLIREGSLAEFLPPVETGEDERGKFGRFHSGEGRKEVLSRSQPVGRRGIPAKQLERLRQALEDFKLKANTERAQPQNLGLIEQFRLPDIAHDPELYRLAGPWWNRRLQVLWGCERTGGSSLPAAAAAAKLHADKFYHLRRALTALLLLLLLLLAGWWLGAGLSHLLSRPRRVEAPNEPARRPPPAGAMLPRVRDTRSHSPSAATSAPARGAPERRAAPPAKQPIITYQIVLCGQEQTEADGVMDVALEVRASEHPLRPVPVEAWHVENQAFTNQDRLEARMKGGRHIVKAVIRDAAGKTTEISAAVTVQPGKVITTPGKVSVRQK